MEIDKRVSGKTKIIGLIGNPVEHSISPMLHNSLSASLGIDLVYVPFKVEKHELENAVKGLKALNIVGFNVTVPYKKDIMKFIDDNTMEALLMGAVNTVKNIDGRFYGYNTDAEGFARSFKEESGSGFKGKRVFILGSGGAARAIAVKVAMEGAEKITVLNRTLSKAQDITDIIADKYKCSTEAFDYNEKEIDRKFFESDIIINTTSVGMHPEIDASPISDKFSFRKEQIVYDVIYNPTVTKFLAEADKTGCKTINGLGMLFYQGIFAYEIWTGVKLSQEKVKEAFEAFSGILKK